jgi:hypothetical protein
MAVRILCQGLKSRNQTHRKDCAKELLRLVTLGRYSAGEAVSPVMQKVLDSYGVELSLATTESQEE